MIRREMLPRAPEAREVVTARLDASTAALLPFARRYIWWKSAPEALAQPRRVIAQVMNLGDHRDVEALARIVGEGVLRDVLEHAEAGQFGERAWAYWHYRLELADVGRVPPLPERRIP
jgi:hypothetical protein